MVSISYVKFVAVISLVTIFLGPLPSIASDEKTITIIGDLSCNRTCASDLVPKPVTPVNGAAVRVACKINTPDWIKKAETQTTSTGSFELQWTEADIFNTGDCAVWIDWAPEDCDVPVDPQFEPNGYKVDWADVNNPVFGSYTTGPLQVSPTPETNCPSN